jgi:hypothetical protein
VQSKAVKITELDGITLKVVAYSFVSFGCVNNMYKSAQLIATSYDFDKIDKSLEKILEQAKKFNVQASGKPTSRKVVFSDKENPLWGCMKSDVKCKSVYVSGSVENLKKIIKIKALGGVYIQLVLEDNDK